METVNEEAPESLYDKMELLPIMHPFLTRKPSEFDFLREGSLDLAKDISASLKKKMLDLGGAGLAANQVGLNVKVFVIGDADNSYAFFNPTIVGVSPEQVAMEESCLSLPGFRLVLQRPKEVVLSYQNEEGHLLMAKYDGIAARVILHEYDHMEGVLFTQHASRMKLDREIKRWRTSQKKWMRRMATQSTPVTQEL